MKLSRRIRFRGTVANRSEASAHLQVPGDMVLVERGRPRLLVVCCPCGCGEQFPVNLDPRSGPAWRFYEDPSKGVSLYPSVWREDGCGSHYIIWRNRVYLCGRYEEDLEGTDYLTDGRKLSDAVRDHLRTDQSTFFQDIAEALDAVPWDVLTICRRLVQAGVASEGKGKHWGYFRAL